MKMVVTKAPPKDAKLKVGQTIEAKDYAEIDGLNVEGYEVISASEHAALQREESVKAEARETIKASAERSVKDAVLRAKAREAIPAKDTELETGYIEDVKACDYKANAVSLVVKAIDALAGKKVEDYKRVTTSSEGDDETVTAGEEGLRETIKSYFQSEQPFRKELKNGGMMRAANGDAVKMKDVIRASGDRSRFGAKLRDFVIAGAEITSQMVSDVVKAGDYVDPASANPLGILNTGLILQTNFGYLSNQLVILNDITTDVSNVPVLFNQQAHSRYMTIPKVMLKSTSNAWPNTGAPTGTVVNVNVLMDKHAGVPLSVSNNILSTTPRQLLNEQRTPQLYSLGEYITHRLAYTAFNGSTRIANDGTSTSTITFNPAYNPSGSIHYFNVSGATLATFVADLPEAMDESKFPGGDEEPGDSDLQRWCWVHGRVYATAAADTNFILNQSIQGIRGQTGDNVMATGRFTRIGNMKFRKSQLATDQCTASGSGADSTTNGITVSAGTFSSATYVGLCGTRSALMFVSRTPLDYTQVLDNVPSTAAIELATEPKTGLTFMVVKFLDHAYETANMRVQLMFGTAIGDERQGMLLKNGA